jgi:hypothetical protein
MKTNLNQTGLSDSPPRYRRRKHVVRPAFQLKHAITLASCVFILTSLVSCILYGVLHWQARQRFLAPETYTAEVGLVILLFATAMSLLTALALAIWFIMVTHRICGPLVLFERCLDEIAQGRIPELRPIRDKDVLHDFWETMSRAIATIRQSTEDKSTQLAQALGTVKAAAKVEDQLLREALESAISDIQLLCESTEQTGDRTTASAPTAKAKQ